MQKLERGELSQREARAKQRSIKTNVNVLGNHSPNGSTGEGPTSPANSDSLTYPWSRWPNSQYRLRPRPKPNTYTVMKIRGKRQPRSNLAMAASVPSAVGTS